MNSKYKITKFKKNKFENIEDLISIEEPLEISLKYKEKKSWLTKSLSITMRTPGHDKDLVRGFLFNEQIIQNIKDIKSIESYGEKVGQYNIQNKILITLNNSDNVNISKIKRPGWKYLNQRMDYLDTMSGSQRIIRRLIVAGPCVPG